MILPRESRARLCAWVLLSLAACFSESPSTTGETGAACPVGTNGCPCDGGACEGTLVCHGPSSNCYEPECTLGSLACPCVDGQCLGGLSCLNDFCEDASGTDGTTGSSMSTGAHSTGNEDTTLPLPLTDGTTSLSDSTTLPDPVTTTLMPETSDVVTDDTLALTGPDEACAQCLMNAPKECTCPECVELAECYYATGSSLDCCEQYPTQQMDWNEYVACAMMSDCALACQIGPMCIG